MYDSSKLLTDTDIEELRKYKHRFHIDKLMLKDHVVPFLQRWKVGFGFLGEQGAELIHARFNSIRKNYSNMPNSVTPDWMQF